ncbi:hypothetical protein MKZ38_007108 [Zalerion maritima]|uniref:Uncharacterized protein n=1 Tax=Zalerion maritima TaxID=339359 RepID=A0AAD5RJ82_9PEZI|nr:hypothetical protein MKZ38_007108 [Zalerion maritima]
MDGGTPRQSASVGATSRGTFLDRLLSKIKGENKKEVAYLPTAHGHSEVQPKSRSAIGRSSSTRHPRPQPNTNVVGAPKDPKQEAPKLPSLQTGLSDFPSRINPSGKVPWAEPAAGIPPHETGPFPFPGTDRASTADTDEAAPHDKMDSKQALLNVAKSNPEEHSAIARELRQKHDKIVELENRIGNLRKKSVTSRPINQRMDIGAGQGIVPDSEMQNQWMQLDQGIYNLVVQMDKLQYIGPIDKRRERHVDMEEIRRDIQRMQLTCSPGIVSTIYMSPDVHLDVVRAAIWAILQDSVFNDGHRSQYLWAGAAGPPAKAFAEILFSKDGEGKSFHRWRCQTAMMLEKTACRQDVDANVDNVVKETKQRLGRWLKAPLNQTLDYDLMAIIKEAVNLDCLFNKQPAWFYVNYPTPPAVVQAQPLPFSSKYMTVDANRATGLDTELVIAPCLWKGGNSTWQNYASAVTMGRRMPTAYPTWGRVPTDFWNN